MAVDRVVVVGAGLAGLRTVQELRGQGFSGALTLVGAERHAPYDRPPLSKEVLRGEADGSTLEADWPALDLDLRLGVRATGLGAGMVCTDRGEIAADAVVVATGAVPRRVAGQDTLVLRSIDDALALRARLAVGTRVVVIGAGWIGAEVATAAATAGCSVDVVEAGPAPVSGALPTEIGALTVGWYDAAGVRLHLGAAVVGVERHTAAFSVMLGSGSVLAADVVVEGVGVRPATDWLADSGIDLDPSGAVLTDAQLRSSRPGVWAVGDAASWWSQRYGKHLRVEHWDDALHAPEVVAASVLAGGDWADRDWADRADSDEWAAAGGPVHDPVPYFWSEQLGHYVQYAGYHPAAARLVRRGDVDDSTGWTVCWLAPEGDGERLVAVLAVDRPRDLVQGRKLIAAGTLVDVGRLVDPSVAVRDVARRG